MINSSEMEKYASAFTQPLIAIPVNNEEALPSELFALTSSRIVVTSITPGDNGDYLVRMYNPEPASEKTGFIWKNVKPLNLVNVDTGLQIPVNENIKIAGMGVVDLKLKMH